MNALQMFGEINQIANFLANITSQCGVGDFVLQAGVDNSLNPRAQLQPLINDSTGLENEPVFSPGDLVFGQQNSTFTQIGPSLAA